MNRIHILPEGLRNKIAAGEIVERPASVLKELVENAIDAGGTRIVADIEEGGRRLIRVTDNGRGMTPEDARLSFERHATSKLKEEADLEAIKTLGFRGEALPSIASVSRVKLVTAPSNTAGAVEVRVEGGSIKQVQEAAAPVGTMVEVADLFYNTPARKKFMKASKTELFHIVHVMQQLALPYPEIHFRLTHNGKDLLDVPSVKTLRERVLQIAGPDWFDQLLELSPWPGLLKLDGLVSNPPFSLTSRDQQQFFVNRRAVRSPLLHHALTAAYDTSMMKGRYPVAFLFLEVPFDAVDVNIHPTKREVRFRDQQQIHDAVRRCIQDRLKRQTASSQGQTARSPKTTGHPVIYPLPGESVPLSVSREQVAQFTAYGSQLTTASGSHNSELLILPLGQIHQTYIVAQVEGELHIIDQHAAHERLLFDRLMAQLDAQQLSVQPLLFSETVELPQAMALRLKEILPDLKTVGLEVEEFGSKTFVIRTLPALLGPVDGRKLLLDLLEDLEEGSPQAWSGTTTKPLSASLQQVMASMACHGAIKAHQDLGLKQMHGLLEDLRAASASTCPHGRPIRVTFSRSDLEKMFRRK